MSSYDAAPPPPADGPPPERGPLLPRTPRHARPAGHRPDPPCRGAVVLLRVLPAPGRRRRGGALALDPRARAAATDVRLGDLRRRRRHPRPHGGDHRADRARDDDAPDGPPDLCRAHQGRARRGSSRTGGEAGVHNVLALRGDPPGGARQHRGPRRPAASSTPPSWWRSSSGRRRAVGGRRRVPRGAPRRPQPRARRGGAEGQVRRRRRVRDHRDGAAGRGLLRAGTPCARHRRGLPSSPGSCRS